jgi:hypothetical protein
MPAVKVALCIGFSHRGVDLFASFCLVEDMPLKTFVIPNLVNEPRVFTSARVEARDLALKNSSHTYDQLVFQPCCQ